MMFVGIAVSSTIKIWHNSGLNSSEEFHDAAFLIKVVFGKVMKKFAAVINPNIRYCVRRMSMFVPCSYPV